MDNGQIGLIRQIGQIIKIRMEENGIQAIRRQMRERIEENEKTRNMRDGGFKDYRMELMGKRGEGRIRNSWGAYDAMKWMQARGWKDLGRRVEPGTVLNVIRAVNDRVAERIARGEEVKLPYRMGSIELRKEWRGAWISGGELKVSYMVDWDRTLKLWYEDKEAERRKTLVRYDNKDLYRMVWNKQKAVFTNMHFYKMKFNRFLRQRLKQNIENGEADALRRNYTKRELYRNNCKRYGEGTRIREYTESAG